MNFKRMELAGFKSFADKTIVKFDGGVTAIVGPNGCGKSNVADAIRWVLGEQRSKMLRGNSMQDVIFNGTEKRKSLSYTEVSLVFDNTNRTFDIEYDEVIMTRKLYRSGESAYYINKTPCRLKDITLLLHDSGIGKEGYSIIGQGKVEEILSAKPENRRSIFEEAAGISKFKAKKTDAERKLARTRDNLTRINDIVLEIERQLKPLQEQAETAKEYLKLRDTSKELELNNYIYKYDNASTEKDQLQIKINAIKEEIANKQKALEEASTDYDKTYQAIQDIDKETERLHAEVLRLTIDLEKRSGDVGVLKEKLTHLKTERDRLSAEIKTAQDEYENNKTILDEKQERLEKDNKLLSSLRTQTEDVSAKYFEVVDELTKSEDEAESNQKQIVDALSELSDVKANLSGYNAEKKALLLKHQEVLVVSKQKSAEFDINKDSKAVCENNILNAQKQKQILAEDYKKGSEKYGLLSQTLSGLKNDFMQTSASVVSLQNRRKMLIEMQNSYEGFAYSVKKMLKDSEYNKEIKSKFIGAVASMIKVPEKYQTAIETSLGNAAQNIVTNSEEEAKYLINYLKNNNYGRITFLPLSSVKQRSLNDYSRNVIKNNPEVYGVASELITFDKKISPAINNLLGSTVIVRNLTSAVSLAKESRYSFRIVTLEGDVINPQGSITGGSKKAKVANLVGREREIKESLALIEKQEQNKKQIETEVELKQKQLDDLSIKNKEVYENISKANTTLEVEKQKLERLESILEVDAKLIENYENSLTEINAKIKVLDGKILAIDSAKENIHSSKDLASVGVEKRQQQFLNLKNQRDSFNNSMTDLKIKIASVTAEINGLDAEIKRVELEQSDLLEDIDMLKDEENKINKNILIAEDKIAKRQSVSDYNTVNNELNLVKENQSAIDGKKQYLQEKFKKLEKEKVDLMQRVSKLQTREYQEELNLAKIDTDIENMQERIWEEYELTYSSALDFKKDDYDLKQGISDFNRVKRQIDNLGFVNINAIEDCKNLSERYEDLFEQANDLTKAESDLVKIIRELSSEMVKRFENQFEKIQKNFTSVFKQLFGGGNAKLVMVEDESGDPLKAGIDIIAEPPGKKLQNITLLSGGEKALTAIAILFAILKLKPMPFCLLDEIEAALDDANVGRFAKYLKRFSNETQFIVITHRKPTMELADSLYGVTMQEKGVSKIVSVKLNKAIESAL